MERHLLELGALSVAVENAQVRRITVAGVEILRGLSSPVRDADWGTYETVVDELRAEGATYSCSFCEVDGLFQGEFRLDLEHERRCTVEVSITFARDADVNRAGFCLLHPIQGVSGTALTIRHSDGRAEQTHFPKAIAPGQPAFDIVGLSHTVAGVTLQISMQGEVFEMEDQRNWSDASYKTYCRPLSQPHPFAVAAGERIRQRVTVEIIDVADAVPQGDSLAGREAVLPKAMLAFDPNLNTPRCLELFRDLPFLARVSAATPDDVLVHLSARSDVALEIIFDDVAEVALIAERAGAAGLRPTRVVALPIAYLKSYQPGGTWPSGPTPADALTALRHAFPGVPAGGGSLTNFTEFNRCPPPSEVDFITFGNTAIVHAADDLSVTQTLESLPDIFASARALRADKPLHLGLFSIAMRSNPYGADIVPNPLGQVLTMTRYDHRQETAFAAAYAIAVFALAAQSGIDSIALAMPAGDLGAEGRPIGDVVRLMGQLRGQAAEVRAVDGLYSITTAKAQLVANMSGVERNVPGSAHTKLASGAYQAGMLTS